MKTKKMNITTLSTFDCAGDSVICGHFGSLTVVSGENGTKEKIWIGKARDRIVTNKPVFRLINSMHASISSGFFYKKSF